MEQYERERERSAEEETACIMWLAYRMFLPHVLQLLRETLALHEKQYKPFVWPIVT
jgi:hypothetical protein